MTSHPNAGTIPPWRNTQGYFEKMGNQVNRNISQGQEVKSMAASLPESSETKSMPSLEACRFNGHAAPGSGAAAAKRAQLKRKASKDGLPENHYTQEYKEKKGAKKAAVKHWVENNMDGGEVPQELLLDFPQWHPKSNLKPIQEERRIYPSVSKSASSTAVFRRGC